PLNVPLAKFVNVARLEKAIFPPLLAESVPVLVVVPWLASVMTEPATSELIVPWLIIRPLGPVLMMLPLRPRMVTFGPIVSSRDGLLLAIRLAPLVLLKITVALPENVSSSWPMV